MRSHHVIGALLAVSLACAPSVRAQDEVAPPDAPAASDAEYRALIAEAVSESNAGRHAEARALFERAHAMRPNARTLRGMGMELFEMREYVQAIAALTAALEHAENPLTPEMRDEASRFIERARTFTGQLRLRVTPAAAQVTIEGEPAAADAAGLIQLDAGQVEVRVVAEGYRSERLTATIDPGRVREVIVALEPLEPARVEADRERGSVRSRAGGSSTRDDGARSGTGWILAGGAALALAGAAASLAWYLDARSALDRCEAASRDPNTACINLTAVDDALLASEIVLGVSTAAAIGLGIAATLALTSGSDGTEDERALACAVLPFGAACAARF